MAPELAPLLLPYGKALLEIASKSQGVLGKEDGKNEEAAPPKSVESSSKPDIAPAQAANFHFEGDEESDDEAQGGEDEEVEDDDFTVAWEVLDLARTLYEKLQSEGQDVGRELGECFGLLGDVSLENGGLLLPWQLGGSIGRADMGYRLLVQKTFHKR